MRHVAALAVGLAVLAGSAWGLAAIAVHSEAPAWAWAWRREPDAAINQLVKDRGTRIVNVWAQGRLVQLHIDASREFSGGDDGAWVVWRLALPDWGLPGCG